MWRYPHQAWLLTVLNKNGERLRSEEFILVVTQIVHTFQPPNAYRHHTITVVLSVDEVAHPDHKDSKGCNLPLVMKREQPSRLSRAPVSL